MKKIGYAIFYKVFEITWSRELTIGTEYMRNGDMQADNWGKLIQKEKKIVKDNNYVGTNPSVFQYQFIELEPNEVFDQLLVMKFYEGIEVWVFPKEGSTSIEY